MAILVIAEHDGSGLKSGLGNAVTAAAKIGGDIHVLIAGQGAQAAEAAGKFAGVAKVLLADNAAAPAINPNVAASPPFNPPLVVDVLMARLPGPGMNSRMMNATTNAP